MVNREWEKPQMNRTLSSRKKKLHASAEVEGRINIPDCLKKENIAATDILTTIDQELSNLQFTIDDSRKFASW